MPTRQPPPEIVPFTVKRRQRRRHDIHLSSRPVASAMPSSTTPNHVYSAAEWKRQPTSADVLFGFNLPYRAPQNAFGAYCWRWRLWFESTFALSMLQPWEKVLIMCIVNSVLILLFIGILCYLPSHITAITKRGMYYLLGTEGADRGLTETLSMFAGSLGLRSGGAGGEL
ncbi:hypothetical protein BXZ70DRAFT_961119 [Cristinia sonorae]|uniref:Uncharacterized protein n=1 Tax=Cristinia sonorae TaxID=1940300 RepID=A0A8K0UF28_9AGAR|nr:hypothetical protein BXZ70DRAFT_961119 [Cristinia sonorae]